jgi:hypothetical protein
MFTPWIRVGLLFKAKARNPWETLVLWLLSKKIFTPHLEYLFIISSKFKYTINALLLGAHRSQLVQQCKNQSHCKTQDLHRKWRHLSGEQRNKHVALIQKTPFLQKLTHGVLEGTFKYLDAATCGIENLMPALCMGQWI